MYVFKLHPHTVGLALSIGGHQAGVVFYLAAVKQVEGGNIYATVAVYVGQAKHILHMVYGEARLFQHLAAHTLLGGFSHIGKASRQVIHALSGLALALLNQQLALAIQDEGHGSGSGIHKKLKATVFTLATLFAIYGKMMTATKGAVLEFCKWIHVYLYFSCCNITKK